MTHLPVRIRLTLAFVVAMAVVLTAVGATLVVRVEDSLREQLDRSLVVRSEALGAVLRDEGDLAGDILVSTVDEGIAQVLMLDGTVIASSPSLGAEPLVSPERLPEGSNRAYLVIRDVPSLPGEEVRLLLTPVEVQGERFVLVVGATLERVGDALEELLAQLFIVGPIALILTSIAGYFLAAAALRPVESMRRHAAAIGTDRPGERLPLPSAHDEIRRLGETLNAMLERLEAGLARERRFVADASHELRTPLSLLQTELELALRRTRSKEELEAALVSAAEETERLARLAEDLLVLARFDEGRLSLRRSSLDSHDLLTTVARRFEVRAAALGRAVAVGDAPEVTLVGDRLRLEQALGNLVDNSLRHGAGAVGLGSRSRNGHVELSVTDEGPGFPPDFLPKAFDRFSRADEARGRGASGLGLAIVRAIAHAHGGEVRAENLASGGAAVTIAIPLDGSTPDAGKGVSSGRAA